MVNDLKERMQELLSLHIDKIQDNIDFFKKLDAEYPKYAKSNRTIYDYSIFKLSHIKNKAWRGLWYKATGIDEALYINWLYYGLNSKEEKSIIDLYKEAHPKERYTPYSIIKANETLDQIKGE